MKITTVRYRRLKSHQHGYGHDAIEAEAQVDEGESAEDALSGLKIWVQERLADGEERDRAYRKLEDIRLDVERYTRDRDRLKGECEEIRKIARGSDDLYELAKKAGREDLAALFNDEIPF